MRREDMRKQYVNGKVNLLYLNPRVEIFYDIPGWPRYKISNMKNVWSEEAHRVLKQYAPRPDKPQRYVRIRDFRGKIWYMNVQKLFWKTFYVPRELEKLRKC